jgi:Arc/MetJ-type ribon-helix-helix transcriptional regulator
MITASAIDSLCPNTLKQSKKWMMEMSSRKVAIRLPPDLLAFIDARAQQRGTSRSQVIHEALIALQSAEKDSLAAAGYRFYADEASAFAQSCLAQE